MKEVLAAFILVQELSSGSNVLTFAFGVKHRSGGIEVDRCRDPLHVLAPLLGTASMHSGRQVSEYSASARIAYA